MIRKAHLGSTSSGVTDRVLTSNVAVGGMKASLLGHI